MHRMDVQDRQTQTRLSSLSEASTPQALRNHIETPGQRQGRHRLPWNTSRTQVHLGARRAPLQYKTQAGHKLPWVGNSSPSQKKTAAVRVTIITSGLHLQALFKTLQNPGPHKYRLPLFVARSHPCLTPEDPSRVLSKALHRPSGM